MYTTKACSKHREAYAKVNADSEMWNADRFGCNTQGAAAPFWAGPCAPAASTALVFPSIGQRTSLRPPALVRIWAGDDKTLGSVLGRRKALSRGEGTAPAQPPYPHRTHTAPCRRPPLTAGRGLASRTARVREGGGGAAPPSRSRLPAPARAQRPVLLPPRSALPQPPPNLRVT